MGNISEPNKKYVDAEVINHSICSNVKILNLFLKERLNFGYVDYWKDIETDFSDSNGNQVFINNPNFRVIELTNILN